MFPFRGRRTPALAGAACLVALSLSLSGCENVKQQLGLGKSAPDEFNVVTRAPLTLPPDYSLRPPDSTALGPQETTVQQQVWQILSGSEAGASDSQATAGEMALLSHAGAKEAMSDIRQVLNDENAIYADEDQAFVDSLIFWRDDVGSEVLVDPTKEAQRLQEAEALGEVPTGDNSAVIERREKGILEDIF
ncbi:MAG: DUF3035 domain-containing protein [Pseudomonadota bacterium]|nr:DUF3035 domain-containing protein [Pseudomonadota bacterium]